MSWSIGGCNVLLLSRRCTPSSCILLDKHNMKPFCWTLSQVRLRKCLFSTHITERLLPVYLIADKRRCVNAWFRQRFVWAKNDEVSVVSDLFSARWNDYRPSRNDHDMKRHAVCVIKTTYQRKHSFRRLGTWSNLEVRMLVFLLCCMVGRSFFLSLS